MEQNINNQIQIKTNDILLNIINELANITKDLQNSKNRNTIIKQIKNIILILKYLIKDFNKQFEEIKIEIKNAHNDITYKLQNLCVNNNNAHNIDKKIKISNHNMGEKIKNKIHNHILEYSDFYGKNESYKRVDWICNLCNNKFNKYIPNFYCDRCCFDVCDKCFIKYKKFSLGEERIIKMHKHSLKYSDYLSKNNDYQNANWICNICYNEFNKYIPNFYCDKCNFDICDNCFIINNN